MTSTKGEAPERHSAVVRPAIRHSIASVLTWTRRFSNRDRELVSRILGVGGLFSGAALVATILTGISLLLSLAFTVSLLAIAIGITWRPAPPREREWQGKILRTGVAAGALALVAYDSSRAMLSYLDPSPYNPFEVIRVFGKLLAGPAAPVAAIYSLGVAFHVVNGLAFGIAYCSLFDRKGLLTGIGWGVFLELFQLTLYPGWLSIRFYREFVQISAVSHIAYGAVLGIYSKSRSKGGQDDG